MTSIKNVIRKIIPVRASVFEKYRKNIEQEIAALGEKLNNATELNERMLTQLEASQIRLNREIRDAIDSGIGKQLNDLNNSTAKKSDIEDVIDKLEITQGFSHKISLVAQEILWAEIFNQSISSSSWLKNAPFSPGRWAVGYPFLYALYRSLNETNPESILELGLGQSTTMLSHYAAASPNVNHIVVEHDQSWIGFYCSENKLSDSTEIVQLPLEMKKIDSCEKPVRVYGGFGERFKDKTFDFITIDAPFGYDMVEEARIDILSILPDALSPSFVIMVDDYNRIGEQNMVKRMKKILDSAEIGYQTGLYEGEKTTFILCSKDRGFLTSL